jgi:hypothetical protein
VLERLHRADGRTVELLRAGAVLGTSFTPAAVGWLLGIGTEEAARRCERAQRTYLVTATDQSYEFTGELIHEVVYDSLAGPTRAAYERTVEAMRARGVRSPTDSGRARRGRIARSCHGRPTRSDRSAARIAVPSPRCRPVAQG